MAAGPWSLPAVRSIVDPRSAFVLAKVVACV